MKLVDGIVDVLYSPQQAKTKITSRSTTTMSNTNDDPNENEKTAEVTGEEHRDRGTVNDDADNVETAKEVGGRRRGRLVLRAVNEEDDFTVFHNDLVEHNTDDGMEETKIKHNQEEVNAHPQKPRRLSPW